MAYFQFFSDEEMTQPLAVLSFSKDLDQTAAASRGVAYFGAQLNFIKLETTENAGVDSVTLTPSLTAAEPERSAAVAAGDEFIVSGYVFRTITAGTTAAAEPVYPAVLGDVVDDGTATLQCVAVAPAVGDLKLSLSAAGLDTAQGGASLSLGATVRGGAPIAVYYEFSNSLTAPFEPASPLLCIAINECTVSTI